MKVVQGGGVILNPEQSNNYFFSEAEEKLEKELITIGKDEEIEIEKLISSEEEKEELLKIIEGEEDLYTDYLKEIGYDKDFNIKSENNLMIDKKISPLQGEEYEGDRLVNNNDEVTHRFQVLEDQASEIRIDEILVKNGKNKDTMWEIEEVINNYNSSEWVEIIRKESKPDNVKDDNVVLYTNYLNDEGQEYLEIRVKDYRDDGEGLLGMEIDMEWNKTGMVLDESRYTRNNLFDNNSLPLFKNIGNIDTDGDIIRITGITAASLPAAVQGKRLGYEDGESTTLFTKIPVKNINKELERNLSIKVNKYPAINDIKIEESQITVIDDNYPILQYLSVRPTQLEVGINTIKLKNNMDDAREQIVIDVINVNDTPITIRDDIPSLTCKQGERIRYEFGKEFYDEDADSLVYTLKENVKWLNIDSKTGILEGIPKNNNVGVNRFTVRATDEEGEYTEKEIKIVVTNVNDSPEIKKQIPYNEVLQNQDFRLELDDIYFTDIDKKYDKNESLTYSIDIEERKKLG